MLHKKNYSAPQLTQHGLFSSLTLQGGSQSVDAPIGTPVNNDITNVASGAGGN